MKTNLLVNLVLLAGLYGCHSDLPEPTEDVAALPERFHGKYKPVQITASELVDVYLDGRASSDLLGEITDLERTHLQINVLKQKQSLFTQSWPEQYLTKRGESIEGPVDYSPDIFVYYANQPVFGSGHFNQQLTEIFLEPEQNPVSNPIHWSRPASIRIMGEQQIQVINQRQLCTRAGWKTGTITALYERYQKTT